MDPKKLNDENEVINYKNIPAELAWEMNLPLPRKYNFIFITGGSCGHMAMFLYFKLLKITRNWTSKTEADRYIIAYNIFISSNQYSIFSCQWSEMTKKTFYLADNPVPLLILTRDPIERIKSLTNHIEKHINKFDFAFSQEEVLTNKYYKMKDTPSIEKVDSIIENQDYFKLFQKIHYFKNITEIITLDTKDIIGEKCYQTFCLLSKKLQFNYPEISLKEYFTTPFVSKVMDMLPLTFVIYSEDKKDFYNTSNHFAPNNKIEIIITFKKMMLYCDQENLVNIKEILLINHFYNIQEEILFLTSKTSYNELLNNNFLLSKVQKYFEKFMIIFEQKIKQEQQKLFKEKDILNYLKENYKP